MISQTTLSDEILWHLGPDARGRVAAVSSLADDPQYSDIAGQWPTSVPRLAGHSETLLHSSPELVIIASFTAPETQALLRSQNIRLRVLDGFAGFSDYRKHVRAIASDLGLTEVGHAYLRDFDRRIDNLRARIVAPSPRLSVVSWHAGNTAGTGTSFDDVADLLSLQNLPAVHGRTGHFNLAGEQLVAWDPDVIVTACLPSPPPTNGCVEAERTLAATPGIAATQAARNHGLMAIPPNLLFSSGSGMLEAAEYMHTQLVERNLIPGVTP